MSWSNDSSGQAWKGFGSGSWGQQASGPKAKAGTPAWGGAAQAPAGAQASGPKAKAGLFAQGGLRPAMKGGAAASAIRPAGVVVAPDTYVVSTKGNDSHEVVVRTLVGEYVKNGDNHGRPTFKKVQVPDQSVEAVDVYLYYWDGRDGPAFEGWWFGNKLGGTQVWSHCSGGAMTPPNAGWKIPWDGKVRNTLIVANKAEQKKAEVASNLKNVGSELLEVGKGAQGAVAQAKEAAGDYLSPEGLKEAEQLLVPQTTSLNEAMKKLMESQRGAVGEAAKQYTQIGNAIRAAQAAVNQELAKLRSSKAKAELNEKNKAAEDRDQVALQEILPDAINKTNAAEDAVEKAVITSEMIAAGGDDLEEVRSAVAQTETAAQEAQKAIGEARIFLNAKQASCRRFEIMKVKTQAAEELGKLQQQLQEAQNKLNPLKNVRQDFVQRTAAQKLVQEVLEKLSPAEVDVDRAEEASIMLGDEASKEMMTQAEEATARATEHIGTVLKFIEQKKRTAAGMAKDEITKMEDRAKKSQTRLTQLKAQHKESAERVTCGNLLKEAAEKLHSVEETVAKAAEAEGPFLMGVEELPLEETLAAVKACETAATAANTAVSIARMFIATKMVEAKRFSPGPSQEAQTKLKEYQTELEASTKKLSELKKATAVRKKAATMREAEHEVTKAEELVKKVGEAASVFQDDAKLFALSSAEIRAASEATTAAEQAANAALTEARKFITARQIEAKGKENSAEVSAELIKYQTRLSTAQGEVGKYKKLSASFESRLAAKRVIEEAANKLKAAEEKVAKVSEMVEALGEESKEEEGTEEKAAEEETGEAGEEKAKKDTKADKPDKLKLDVKAAEQASAEAQVAIKTFARYLDTQTRVQGGTKEELSKMQPQVKECQEKLDAAVAKMHERQEKLVVSGLVKEARDRVTEAEEAVNKVSEAEKPFLKDADELPVEEASTALSTLETATSAAHTCVGGAKTFLAMKRLAAKRLSENSSKAATEELTALQGRLDEVAKKLVEIKKGMAERKMSTVKREVAAKVEEVKKKVETAVEATTVLTETGNTMAPEAMKNACEKAGATQQAAGSAITATRTLLLNRQKDAKGSSADSGLLTEITKMIEQLTKFQADLEKQKALVREQEHQFVAKRLLQDATEMLDQLDKKLESATETAAPLTSDGEDFTATIFLSHAVDSLRRHLTKNAKTAKDLFATLSESKPTLPEAKFLAFMSELPELQEQKDMLLSEEQLKAVYSKLVAKGDEELKEEAFIDQCRSRYLVTAIVSMTEAMTVKGGKTIRKLEVGEIVEALEEPTKDDAVGLMRLKAKAEKDDKEGYITVAGNQGTVYLEAYSPQVALRKKCQQVFKDLETSAKDASKYIEQKTEELRAVRTGPLSETKSELMKMRPRISKVQYAFSDLNKKFKEASKKQDEAWEMEKQRRKEQEEKAAADEMIKGITELMNKCDEEVGKLLPEADKLAKSRGADEENPLTAMDKMEKDLQSAIESIESTNNKIKSNMDTVKSAVKGPFGEARTQMVKLKVKVGALDSKCKKAIAALKTARKGVADDAHVAVMSAFRAHVQGNGIKPDDLFKQLSNEGTSVPATALREYIEKIPDSGLKASQLEVGLDRFQAGLTKLTLLELVQEYQRCVKDIAITTAFAVKESKSLRKLLVGEIIEVLEASKKEEETGMARVRCRAIFDHKEGWATLCGNQGTKFMEKTAKPYYCCEEETSLQQAFASSSDEVRKIQAGDVLEILEGPRKEDPQEIERVRGKALKDGKSGWVTIKDSAGNASMELAKLLVCRQSIAITTTFDIAEGKAIRKLEVGETLEVVEGPTEDSQRSLTRVRAKSNVDGKEGWVTMRGNQGTSYAEETDKHHICRKPVPLEARLASGSSQHRMLEEGEVFEVTDGPKTETKEGATRVRGRSLGDGAEGWFTLSDSNMQPWCPNYKCLTSTALNDGLDIKESKTVRKLEPGELVEALETPVLEKAAGLMRVRIRAERDGATGYATVRGNQGTVLLKPTVCKD